jgi:pSer/pThr/pTyr-binding forkhead associated (FHA) protein
MSQVLALQVVQDGRVIGRCYLEHEAGAAKMGRDVRSALVLRDSAISRVHGEIFSDGTNFYVEDLHSTNGTLLNGRKVKHSILKDKDKIAAGAFAIHVTIGWVSVDDLQNNGFQPLVGKGSMHDFPLTENENEPTLSCSTPRRQENSKQ